MKINSIIIDILNGKLTPKIDLHGQKLSGVDIQNLTEALTNTNSFYVTSRIIEINLAETGITELPLNMFQDCDGVEEINLSNNNMQLLPNLPDRPYALISFNANNNPITYINPLYFKNCISLKDLFLKNTKLEDTTPLDLSDCLSLIKYERRLNRRNTRKRKL